MENELHSTCQLQSIDGDCQVGLSGSRSWDAVGGMRCLLGIKTYDEKGEEAGWRRGRRQSTKQVRQSLRQPGGTRMGGSVAGLSHQSHPTVHWNGWAFTTSHPQPLSWHSHSVKAAPERTWLPSRGCSAAEADLKDADSWTACSPHPCSDSNSSPKRELAVEGIFPRLPWGASTFSTKACSNPWVMSTMAHVHNSRVCVRYSATQHYKRAPMAKAGNCNIMMMLENKQGLEENQKAYKSNGEWNLPAI